MDSSSENPHPRITIQPENPLQFTIHLPQPSTSSGNGVQSPNLVVPNFGENPSSSSTSIQDHFLQAPIPKGRRCGRPRNPASYLNQARNFSSVSLNSRLGNVGVSPVASSSGQANKVQMETPSNLMPKNAVSSSGSGNVAKKPVDDMSEEIIVINKEATSEALIALTAGFPADSLTEEEIEYGVVSVVGGIEQVNYILIRNHIIRRWRENVSSWITKEMFVDIVPKHCGKLLDTAYGYLVSYGYINFGVAPAIKERILVEPKQLNVIVIGAGLAGLAAARQLMSFGFKVTVLEGRKRPGGRVYTKKLEGSNIVAAADLGGSVLTGTLGNPLGILARQLSFTLHKVRDKCPLYRVDGTPVDPDLDRRVENSFNQLLDKLSKLRLSMGEVSQDVSLGAALETFREDFNEEEMSLFSWHLANLEYANASLISNLSLAFWDQDDPYDMGGDHCFLPGGNGRLVQALAEGVPIHYEKTVQAIRYGSNGVKIAVSGGQIYEGDMALCTVPLGVLKNGSIKFMPELPQRKLDAIRRLGFGLLNKVALLFPYAFWGTHLDTFGHLSDHPSRRGEFFLFYSYATVAGGPILIGLVAGEAAYKFEVMEPTDAVERVLRILRDIYEPQGIKVPDPVQTVCTRWGMDPLSCGSYSNVAVGASGDDYDILAESVGDGRLFFAGEATNRRYPATMHGAFLSGFREAANIAHHAKVKSLRLKVEKNPSHNAHTCASILADLFRQPDVEFGSFAVLFGRKNADSIAMLRVTFGGHRKKPDQQYTNKLLFEQLQSHFNQQLEFHVYTLLSKQQALQLREVRGGDEGRLNYLEKVGVKLVGRKGLGPSADSVIASIKAERSGHRRSRINKSSPSGLAKLKTSSANQKLIRKAKVVGNSNVSSIPSTITQTKASNAGMDADSKTLATSNSLSYPSSNIGVTTFSGSKELPPNSCVGTGSVGDIRSSVPHDVAQSNCLMTSLASNNESAASNGSNSLAPLSSNVGMMLFGDVQSYNPHSFLAGHLNPASSNSSVRVLNTNGALSLPLDVQTNILGSARGANTQNYISNIGLVAPPAPEIGTRLIGNSSGPTTSNYASSNDLAAPPTSETGIGLVGSNSGPASAPPPSNYANSNGLVAPSASETGIRLAGSSSGSAPSSLTIGSFNNQSYAGDISDGISFISNQDNIFEDIMNDLLPPPSTNSGTWHSTGKL